MGAGGDHGAPRLLPRAARGARRERRARRLRGAHAAGAREDRDVRRLEARHHRRAVPGVQGMGRGLPDRRRGHGGARARDRRADLCRAGAGRRCAAAADPGPPGDGERTVRRRRDGDVAATGGRRALNVPPRVEDLLRELAPQVLGTLARRSGDFAAAEDAVQEALLAAAVHWSREGVPEEPRGWLLTAATRRLIDRWRSDHSRRERERLALQQAAAGPVADEDDTLTVLFMCCHPTLGDASAIALTLRAVGGLTTAEIARAFLVGAATMAQRI